MFFCADLVSKPCKGTWFCCLDPHRRVSPTQRTTRYSVFKERPRPGALVQNAHRRLIHTSSRTYTHCRNPTRWSVHHGSGIPPRVIPATGAETYVSPACRSRGILSPLEGFSFNPWGFRVRHPIMSEFGSEQNVVSPPGSTFRPSPARESGPRSALDRLKRLPVAPDDGPRSYSERDWPRRALQRV